MAGYNFKQDHSALASSLAESSQKCKEQTHTPERMSASCSNPSHAELIALQKRTVGESRFCISSLKWRSTLDFLYLILYVFIAFLAPPPWVYFIVQSIAFSSSWDASCLHSAWFSIPTTTSEPNILMQLQNHFFPPWNLSPTYFPSSSKSWYSSVNRVQVMVAILDGDCLPWCEVFPGTPLLSCTFSFSSLLLVLSPSQR